MNRKKIHIWIILLSILLFWESKAQNHDFYSGDYSNSSIIGMSLPGTWRPFNNDSPWNTPIGPNPEIHPKSDTIMQRLVRTAANIRLGNTYLPPIWVVNQDNMEKYHTASTATPFDIWDIDHNRISDVPAPINITMWGEQTADGHIIIVDPFHKMSWEMSRYTGISENSIDCSTFNIWDLTDKGVGNPNEGWRSGARGGRGSGFPVIAGLIRPEEIEAGEIRHALAFTFEDVMKDDVYYPASRSDGKADFFDAPGMGMLFQLNPQLTEADFNSWGLSTSAKVAARALQKYGMYLCDCGGAMALQVQLLDKDANVSRQKWDEKAPGLYSTLKNIPTNQFRVIKTVDPVHRGTASMVTTPLIIPVCGTFDSPQPVTIKIHMAWPNAKIHYTLDGSDPTISSNLYNGPFLLTSSANVKAKAYDSSGSPSQIMRAPIIISENIVQNTPSLTSAKPMFQVNPTPFRDTAEIVFELAMMSSVCIEVYNGSGGLVNRYDKVLMPTGSHSILLEGRDNKGIKLPPGVYYVRVTIGQTSETRRVIKW